MFCRQAVSGEGGREGPDQILIIVELESCLNCEKEPKEKIDDHQDAREEPDFYCSY